MTYKEIAAYTINKPARKVNRNSAIISEREGKGFCAAEKAESKEKIREIFRYKIYIRDGKFSTTQIGQGSCVRGKIKFDFVGV